VDIVLANYRYFVSGGPERYMFSIKDLMERHGHAVHPFSVRSGRNVPTPYEAHFMSPMGRSDAHLYKDYKKTPATMAKVLSRCVYSPEGFRKARRFAIRTRADVAYCLQYLNKMSPSILDGFKAAGVPVVVRCSDYSLVCPQGHLLADDTPCNRCVSGGFLHAVRQRCVMGSLAGSLVKAMAWRLHRLLGCIGRINALVCPSAFLKDTLIAAGIPEDKLHHVPTFIDASAIEHTGPHDGGFVFAGRATRIKGVELLAEAYEMLGDAAPPLTITGCADDDCRERLAARGNARIRLLPFMEREELFAVIGRALAVVTPSLWYDNLPNAVLEAYALGRPVIAPDHGTFPELVSHMETGLLFAPNNAQSLTASLEWAAAHPERMAQMGRAARRRVETAHSPGTHYAALMRIMERTAEKKRG